MFHLSIVFMMFLLIIFYIIVFLIFIGGIVLAILSIVLLVLYSKDRTKKRKKVLSIIFGIVGISILLLYAVVGFVFGEIIKTEVKLPTGESVWVSPYYIKNFYKTIDNGDTKALEKFLNKYPELLYSFREDGYSPMSLVITNKDLNCMKFFVKKGTDINRINEENTLGAIEVELVHYNTAEKLSNGKFRYDKVEYSNYDEEIMEFLLSQDNIDVNKNSHSRSNIIMFIELILIDNNITSNEEKLLIQMLKDGADIYKVDKDTNYDTMQYITSLDYSKEVEKVRQIVLSYK